MSPMAAMGRQSIGDSPRHRGHSEWPANDHRGHRGQRLGTPRARGVWHSASAIDKTSLLVRTFFLGRPSSRTVSSHQRRDDDDGEEITSCVIEPVGELAARRAAKVAKPKPLTNAAKTALRALDMAVGDLGEVPPSNHVPAGARAVTVKQWREYAFKVGISTSEDAPAKGADFNRASETLIAAQRVGVWDIYAWPVFQQGEGK
jgi:hypothetical protein